MATAMLQLLEQSRISDTDSLLRVSIRGDAHKEDDACSKDLKVITISLN